MIQTRHKQRTTGLLIIYLILSLLFAMSVKLHIHIGDTARHTSHGSTVAITAIDDVSSAQHDVLSEIEVSLDKFTNKINKHLPTTLAVVTYLMTVPVAFYFHISTIRETNTTITPLPFAGTPPLRAPPR